MTPVIRAHHLLCIPRFYGGGYNRVFGKNLKQICFAIRKDPKMIIKIVKRCDAICDKCPYKKNGVCKQTPKISSWVLNQDNKVLRKLCLKENSSHVARDVFNLSMEKVNLRTIKSVCNGCPFLENCIHVGINESFRRELNRRT
jgi:hypothetical protein